MEINNTWIKSYRSILEWEWFTEPRTLQVFTYCLLKANYKEKKWKGIVIPTGCFITSYTQIAADLKTDKSTIRRVIDKLVSTGELARKSTNKYTMLIICKYESYQHDNFTDNTQNDTQFDTQTTLKEHANDTQTTPTKESNNIFTSVNNLKKENKEKKEKPRPLFNFILREGEITDEEFLLLPQVIQDTKEYFEMWCKHKKTHKFRYTKKGALDMFTEQAKKLVTKERIIKAIEFSIEKDYAGIFEQKRDFDEIIYPIDLSTIHKNTTNENFIKFIEWVEKYYPRLNRMREPFTEEQFNALFPKYTRKQLEPFFTQINNSVYLYSKKFSPFSTILEEIQKQQNPK